MAAGSRAWTGSVLSPFSQYSAGLGLSKREANTEVGTLGQLAGNRII